MSALANQPTNNNFLSPLGFKFIIKKTPNVNYFVQSVVMPAITLNIAEVPNPFIRFPLPGTNLTFGQFDVTFKIDEDMENYLEIYNWLIGLGFPDEFQQYANLAANEPGTGQGLYSDCALIVLSSAMNPNMEITFNDCFPVSLTAATFVSTDPDVNYLEATASFACKKFTVTKL